MKKSFLYLHVNEMHYTDNNTKIEQVKLFWNARSHQTGHSPNLFVKNMHLSWSKIHQLLSYWQSVTCQPVDPKNRKCRSGNQNYSISTEKVRGGFRYVFVFRNYASSSGATENFKCSPDYIFFFGK